MKPEPEPHSDDAVDEETRHRVAGHRVLRALATGSHATIYLATADTGAPGCAVPRRVALKVFEGASAALAADDEAAALAAVDGSLHVVRLIDVESLADGAVALVLERLCGGSLASLLDRPGTLAPGQAVTILASLVRGVGDLHRAGWSHCSVSAGCVLFDEAARPSITGLGHATALPGARADSLPLRRQDWEGVRTIVDSVLDHAELDGREDAAERVRESARRLAGECSDPAVRELESALFALAPAAPVVLVARPIAADGAEPRIRFTGLPEGTRRERRRPSATRPSRLLAAAADVMETGPMTMLRARLGALARGRTRPLIAGAIVGALVLTASLTALAPSDASRDGPRRATGQPTPRVTATDVTGPAKRGASPQPTITTGDDPVAAARLLLAERDRCLAQASVECLDAVDQHGSAAMEADTAAIVRGSRPVPSAGYAPSLIELMGGVALIELAPRDAQTPAASALVVRVEAGWRIREIVAN